MATAKTTTNHDEIKKWVEKNGGCPARVKATGRGKNDPGILRIDYPGFSGQDTLVKMDWDEWLQAFDANGLAFVYQPSTRFSKLVSRRSAAAKGRSKTRAKTRSTRGTARRSATAGRRTGAKKSTARRGTTSSASKKRASARPAKRTTKRATKRGSARQRA